MVPLAQHLIGNKNFNMAPRAPQMGGMGTPTHTKPHQKEIKRDATALFEKNTSPGKILLFLIGSTCPTHYNMHSFWRRLTQLTPRPGWPYLDVPWSIRPSRIQIWSQNFSVTARSIFRTNGKPVIFQAKKKRKSTSGFWELHGWTPLVESDR